MGPAPSDVASAAAAATTAPEDTAPATAAGRVQIKIADFGLARSYLPDEQAYTDWVSARTHRGARGVLDLVISVRSALVNDPSS